MIMYLRITYIRYINCEPLDTPRHGSWKKGLGPLSTQVKSMDFMFKLFIVFYLLYMYFISYKYLLEFKGILFSL